MLTYPGNFTADEAIREQKIQIQDTLSIVKEKVWKNAFEFIMFH